MEGAIVERRTPIEILNGVPFDNIGSNLFTASASAAHIASTVNTIAKILFDKNGALHPTFDKDFWVGPYYVSIKVK